MYHFLRGELIEKAPTSVVLDVKGVGYYLQIPVSTYSDLPSLGQDVKLLTHFIVREDAHLLCGFLTEDEREMFRLLISVSGVGPRVAMTALSGVSVYELKRAIADGQLAVLTGISGIGKKTAERMVVELKEKMVVERHTLSAKSGRGAHADQLIEDSLQALISLGYKKNTAQAAVDKVLKTTASSDLNVEALIRASLKHI